jgi:predicted RNase H-like nuclease (RuvC/YqgF family)
MTISYIKQFKDDDGEVTHEQCADGEIRFMNRQIEQLKAALEIQMQTVADLRELLDAVRKIAYDINEQMLKGQR